MLFFEADSSPLSITIIDSDITIFEFESLHLYATASVRDNLLCNLPPSRRKEKKLKKKFPHRNPKKTEMRLLKPIIHLLEGLKEYEYPDPRDSPLDSGYGDESEDVEDESDWDENINKNDTMAEDLEKMGIVDKECPMYISFEKQFNKKFEENVELKSEEQIEDSINE